MMENPLDLARRTGKPEFLIGYMLLWILLFGICSLSAQVRLELKAMSTQGVPLDSVEVGKPFYLVVTGSGVSRLQSEPQVQGIDKVDVVGRSFQTSRSTFQGVSQDQVSVSYTLVAHTQGDYSFGPATSTQFPGVSSSTVSVKVVNESSAPRGEYAQPTYRFTLNKNAAYLGEKLLFSAKFMWQDPTIKVHHLQLPESEFFSIKRAAEGQAKTEKQGTQTYQVIEFSGFLYPKKPGTIKIPPLRADYSVPSNELHWSSFFSVSPTRRHSVFSPPLDLVARPVPSSDKLVLGVGTFTSYSAVLSAPHVPQNEAVTLTLTLKGEADFDQIQPPLLTLPSSFRQYVSRTALTPEDDGCTWDYVIQGLEEGTFTVPPQEAFVFDTARKIFKTLKTQPLTITVTKGAISKEQPKTTVPVEQIQQEKDEPDASSEGSDLPVIPLPLFLLLMLVPPLFFSIRHLILTLSPYYTRYKKRNRSSQALYEGQKQIKRLQKDDAIENLYDSIKHALLLHADREGLRDDELEEYIISSSLDQPIKMELLELLREALAYSPYAAEKIRKSTSADHQNLFSKALHLIQQLGNLPLGMLIGCVATSSLYSAISLEDISQPLAMVPFILWQLGVLISWWLLWFFWRRYSREGRYLLVVFSLVFGFGWALRSRSEYRPRAVARETALLYIGPSTTYPVRATLKPEEEVVLVKDAGEWYYVSSKDGIGWVKSDLFEKRKS